MLPTNIPLEKSGVDFYGAATILVKNSEGNEVFQQTIHNRLLDQGEKFMINQTFTEGGALDETADNRQISAICITNNVIDDESDRASNFDGRNTLGQTNHCRVDSSVDDATASQAVIGPLTFTAGTNLNNGDQFTGIGICQGNGGTDYGGCADATTTSGGAGILFAEINTADVTLNAGDTVDITYTFDLTSNDD